MIFDSLSQNTSLRYLDTKIQDFTNKKAPSSLPLSSSSLYFVNINIYYYSILKNRPLCIPLINYNPRDKGVMCFLLFTRIYVGLWVRLLVGLYKTSWPNVKRYRPEIWHIHSRKLYLNIRAHEMWEGDTNHRGPCAPKGPHSTVNYLQ